MNVLVTGGAGYIGSVITEGLLEKGHAVAVLDNLQQGHREAVAPGAEFYRADLRDASALEDVFRRFKADAVMHMAAETVVTYSVTDPRRFFESSLIGGLNLLDAMLKHDVAAMVFSSSAAVYGEPQSLPVTEDSATVPVNSYGDTKLMFEGILRRYRQAYGLNHICLRYFNAAGASRRYGESHHPETHLIPNILRAALEDSPVEVFGTDYPTPDGSCMRDYVHVLDIAQAHIKALGKVAEMNGRAFNLGNGEGYSVLQVVAVVQKVTGKEITVKLSPRRPGDPAVLVASSELAKRELDWGPAYPELESIVASAWDWLKEHPAGYRA